MSLLSLLAICLFDLDSYFDVRNFNFRAVDSGISNRYEENCFTVIISNLFNPCGCLLRRVLFQSCAIMADKMRRQLQEISLGVNDPIVVLPDSLCEEAVAETRFSLVVIPTNPRKQNLRAMMATLPRLWGFEDEVTGRIIQNRKIQFLFSSEDAMHSVLKRGPWSFNEWMCVIQIWNPNHTDDDLGHIPFWIQIRGIPLQYITPRMVMGIGSTMGHFMETDLQSENAVHVDYVRMRLLWAVNTPLRFQRLYRFGGETSLLKFRYEKLRNFCPLCGSLQHDDLECPTNLVRPPPVSSDDSDPSEDGDDDESPDTTSPFIGPLPCDEPPQAPNKTKSNNTDPGQNSKKRKADTGLDTNAPVLLRSDLKQAFEMDDNYESILKRKCHRAELFEGKNWFVVPCKKTSDDDKSVGDHATKSAQHKGDGSVGHNPPGDP